MDLGLLYRALTQKQVDMVAGNTTDGVLSVLDAVVLSDNRSAFPPYQASLVVREQSLAANPGLEAALNELSGKISEQTMRRLNHEADGKHRPMSDIATDFLHSAGLE
jgi:osmoprotectant transport system substrate-binding protein